MEAYLIATSEKLKSNNYADLNLVIGNESCDLDSAISALVYGTFLHWQYMQIKCKVCTRAHRDEAVYKEDIFVPILNVDRQDYNLKTEVVYCLKEHGIDEKNLVFRDDQDLKELVSSHKASVTLVDHHILAKSDQFLVPYVTEIIDHRPTDNDNWKYKEDTRSTIEIVGSCCTLVAQRIRDLAHLMGKPDEFFSTYPICADLLHSVIILDTVNFSKEVNKATPHDEDIVTFLENILKPNNNNEEFRRSKLDRLVAARTDVSTLTPAQLLKKDVKIVGDILVPSFPILVEEFLQKPGALSVVSEALRSRGCALGLLLGMSLGGGLRRDGAVVSPLQPDRAAKFAKHLQSWTSPPLQLTPHTLPVTDVSCLYFTQAYLSASRKQYMPAITQFLQNEE